MSWRRVERVATPWQRVEVWSTPRAVELRAGGAVHAWWHRERLLSGLAWDALAAAALLRPAGPPASVLLLGVAGGTSLRILRHLVPEVYLTGVEIDADILDLGRRYLELDTLDVELHVADALEWVSASGRRFDVVIDDCYLAGATDVCRSGWTTERRELLAGAVAPGGLLVVNLVNSPGHEATVMKVTASLQRGWRTVRRVCPPDSWNEILAAGDTVAGGDQLAAYAEHFPNRHDRRCWRRLTVS